MIDARIIEAIENAIAERQPQKAGRETKFLCPDADHEDTKPSARWNPDKLVWNCDSCGKGGGAYNLAQLLGIVTATGLTLAQLAEAKMLPIDFLQTFGVEEDKYKRRPCVLVPWCDARGEVFAIKKRLSLAGEPKFIYRTGDKLRDPYNLRVLDEAKRVGYVVWVEGESDCWASAHAGIPALGVPGASNFKPEWAQYTEGIDRVFVWQEPGKGGATLVAKTSASIPDVRVIVGTDELKDPSALWIACGADVSSFRTRMQQMMEVALPASELRREQQSAEAQAALELAQDLLLDPDLLIRVEDAIRDGGYAGDTNPPMIVYNALTSRLLERPINLAVVAVSGAGKNASVDAALDLMPETAYHLEKAGSARALIYNDVDYRNIVVVVGEADSIPQDEGSAASAIRSLAADNFMSYDVVEKDDKGRQTTRRIVKPGPTGLITTSTRSVQHQLNTRVLEVAVLDSPTQTREVMHSHAASVNGNRPHVDVEQFVAAQLWLQLAGERRVLVPFAYELADLIPNTQVRMRRDFRQFLTAVQASALLHQLQRERNNDGWIIATIEDYAHARSLLLEVFQTVATGGVSKAVRETVAAVAKLYRPRDLNHPEEDFPVTGKAVADELKLDKSAVSRRVQKAVSLGYVVNRETKKGQPAKLVPGDPLPERVDALPTIAQLLAALDLPETDATVQPDPADTSESNTEPEPEPVADPNATVTQPDCNRSEDEGRMPFDEDEDQSGCNPVAERLHDDMQPPEEADSDMETTDPNAADAGLQSDQDEQAATCCKCDSETIPWYGPQGTAYCDQHILRAQPDRGHPDAQCVVCGMGSWVPRATGGWLCGVCKPWEKKVTASA